MTELTVDYGIVYWASYFGWTLQKFDTMVLTAREEEQLRNMLLPYVEEALRIKDLDSVEGRLKLKNMVAHSDLEDSPGYETFRPFLSIPNGSSIFC